MENNRHTLEFILRRQLIPFPFICTVRHTVDLFVFVCLSFVYLSVDEWALTLEPMKYLPWFCVIMKRM